jgi:uncharacterized Zn finger protein (UPF0148 family)
MICPICSKGELKEQISLKHILFLFKKEVITFCPLCGFRKVNEFKITKEDFERESLSEVEKINIERIKAQNTKKEEKDSNYKEDKKYKRD